MSADGQHPETQGNSGPDAPKIGTRSTPVWLLLLLGAMLYCASLYTDSYSGGFRADVYDPNAKQPPEIPGMAEDPLAARGRKLYGANCSPCHGPEGAGVPGQFPPLAGSDWVQVPKPDRIIRIVLNGASGPIKVNGKDFNGAMVPWRDVMTDDMDIAAVLTFVRSQWGNKAVAVKPEQVGPIRKETADKGGQWAPEDLLKIPVD